MPICPCNNEEFEKRDIFNKVALHAGIVQLTIFHGKGCLHWSLNAHTAVLAAANPYTGRYRKEHSVKNNMYPNDALMSLFVILLTVLDRLNIETTTALRSTSLMFSNTCSRIANSPSPETN